MIAIQVYDIQRIYDTPKGHEVAKLLDHVILKMPEKSKIISIVEQYGLPCIVAVTDSQEPTANRKIVLRATGKELALAVLMPYIGSLLADSGHKLIHYFDGGE